MILLAPALLLLGAQAGPVDVVVASRNRQCEVRIDGDLLPPGALLGRAKQWASARRTVRVVTTGATDYRCVGGTIFSIQMGGVDRLFMVMDGRASRVPSSMRHQ